MSQLEECHTTHQFRYSTWTPHWVSGCPAETLWTVILLACLPRATQFTPGRMSIAEQFGGLFSDATSVHASYHFCRVWWHLLPVFPPQILVGKRPTCRGAGRSTGWWVGGDLVLRCASQSVYFVRYLSVDLWPQCTSLLRSLCLSSTFFPPNGSPCSLFLLPLFLCRPDQRWQ